jgi:hypothetical protein
MSITVEYMEPLTPVRESEVQVLPMRDNHRVLRLPGLSDRNPEIELHLH